MKHFLLASMLVLIQSALFAQITLTSADMPSAGAVIYTDYLLTDSLDNINIGSAGANQNWNFSNAVLAGFPYPLFYITPAEAPQPNPIAGADLVATDEVSDSSDYEYFKKTSSLFATLGATTGGDKSTFGQPLKRFEFPATYLSTFNQSTTVAGSFDGISVTGTAKTAVKVDGYGNVTTDLGTFPCLRVQRINELSLTVFFFTVLQRDTTLEWWTNSYDAPVFSYIKGYADFAGDEEYYTEATILTQQTVAVADPKSPNAPILELYPNPAVAGQSNLRFELSKSGKTELTVLDVQGKLVRQEFLGNLTPGEYTQVIDLNGANNGTYAVVLRQEGRLIGVRKLVKN